MLLVSRCFSRLTTTRPLYNKPLYSTTTAATTIPHLDVNPQVALVDEKVCITASGLNPQQKVSLRASLKEGTAVYSSCVHFVADQQGCVDTTQHSSLGGTYKGSDCMGLFWSMKPVPKVSKKSRLMKTDVTTPLIIELSLLTGHVDFEDLQQSASTTLATTTCERWYKHKDVRKIVVREGPLRGTVFLPPGNGPFPGVVDMFGSSGSIMEFRAALLASRGFAAFALAYFGFDDLPPSLEELDFSYFLKAVNWFSDQLYVQPGSLGLVGTSKGGELAFILGMVCEKVKAIVNISGSPCLAFYDLKWNGNVFLKGSRYIEDKTVFTDDGITMYDCFPDIEDHIIPVWQNDAHILYLCGDDDGTWDTQRLTGIFERQCPEEKRKNIEVVIYPGAGHLIEPPYMPLCRSGFLKLLGTKICWGGQPEPHAAAQEDAWRRLLDFLHKHLDHEQSIKSHL